MSLNWGEGIFSNLYPLIQNLYVEEFVIAKPSTNVIELKRSVGFEVEKKLQEHFIPSFFNQNLCEKTSLMGRISANLFFICEKLRLHKVFTCFDQNSKLFSIVLKAERCWLAHLLDTYHDVKRQPQNVQKLKFIAQHLACVVTKKNEVVSNEEVQRRLNELVALTNVFYEIHGKGHNYVTGGAPQTYFSSIFSNI